MVPHACNHSYSRGRDQENHSSRPAWVKKLAKPHINQQASMVIHTYNPNYAGGLGRTIWSEAGFRQKVKPYLKNILEKQKGMRV
jgi:hypothetical protein